VLLSTDGTIHSYHLPPSLQQATGTGAEPSGKFETVLYALEQEMITDALQAHHGKLAAAARALGLTERIMGLRVHKHGIDPGRFKRHRARTGLDAEPGTGSRATA